MRRTLVLTLISLAACSPAGDSTDTSAPDPTSSTTTRPATTTSTVPPVLAISSPAFEEGAEIPAEYTCDGADISPELDLVGLPASTRSITVIVEDPDAPLGTWYHWVEYDIVAEPGPFVIERDTSTIGVPGANSWNLEGYMGPCPPEGEEHEYVFRVYAVSTTLDLPAGVDASEVITAMDGHVVDSVEFTGIYGR